MNADDIRAIKERAERTKRKAVSNKDAHADIAFLICTDIPALCAALEEAMAEIERLEKQKALWATANHILTVIAEGYPAKGEGDRYVVVENPNYRPDNGSEPNIVYDCGD